MSRLKNNKKCSLTYWKVGTLTEMSTIFLNDLMDKKVKVNFRKTWQLNIFTYNFSDVFS